MVCLLAWRIVDRGFEPRSGQTKDYKIDMCCLTAKHTALRRKSAGSRLSFLIFICCQFKGEGKGKQHIFERRFVILTNPDKCITE
jgi:hypothetical protein